MKKIDFDLETGMCVMLRCGEYYKVMLKTAHGDVLTRLHEYISFKDYYDCGLHKTCKDKDIVTIFKAPLWIHPNDIPHIGVQREMVVYEIWKRVEHVFEHNNVKYTESELKEMIDTIHRIDKQ